MNYTKHFQTKSTPQTEKIPGTNQIPNSAGGFSWSVDLWARLDRFLILGSEGGSYYASEKKLTIENAEAVQKCLLSDGERTVNRIVEISTEGRAPKNDPAIFALAMCASLGDAKTKKAALYAMPKVCRIATHLFQFLTAVQSFRGWGFGLKKSVCAWYDDRTVDSLAYQMCKYRQRGGWTHRDVLRLAHPSKHSGLYDWICGRNEDKTNNEMIEAFRALQSAQSGKDAAKIIEKNASLTWEMVPDALMKDEDVWKALLPNMPMTAMIRNFARMTANGSLKPLSKEASTIVDKLKNADEIHKARVHPIAILSALKTYASGHGNLGSLTWQPISPIMDALDEAFYRSFDNVEPTNKRHVLALDVSGSMSNGAVAGVQGLSPRVASSAMAMVTARTEPNYQVMAFSTKFMPLNITPKQRLDDICKMTEHLPFEGTDCALPMIWALKNKVEADVFIVYTDSETWAGSIHPSQALVDYRKKMGINAKLIVCGMVANDFTIADSNDGGMLDCVGFDSSVPAIMADFVSH